MKNKFKKILLFISILFLTSTILPPSISYAVPSVDAKAFVLMDAKSGIILDSNNEDQKLPPASTTKVMTAIITLEKAKFTDKVEVKEEFGDLGTTIGLRKGEVISVEDLLYGMLLLSANDCAVALAEHIGGSVEGFAKLMNEKAKELGCENTNFVNPSGLHDSEHYSTAKDMALILKEALRYPDFINIAQQPNHQFQPSNIDGKRHWATNKNYMITKTASKSEFYYKYTLAGKTGYTKQANNTLVTSAKKDGQTLIATILNSDTNCMNDAKNLFEYGFNTYSTIKLYSADEVIGTCDGPDGPIELSSPKDIFYTVKKGEENNIQKQCNISEPEFKDSYKKGETITSGELIVNGNTFKTISLSSINDLNFNSTSKNSIFKGKNLIFIIAGILIVIITIIAIIFGIKRKKKINNEAAVDESVRTADDKLSVADQIKNSKNISPTSNAIDDISEIAYDSSTNDDYYDDNYYDNSYYDDNYNDDNASDKYYDNNSNNYYQPQSNTLKNQFKEKTQNPPIMSKINGSIIKQATSNVSTSDIMAILQMQAKNTVKPRGKSQDNIASNDTNYSNDQSNIASNNINYSNTQNNMANRNANYSNARNNMANKNANYSNVQNNIANNNTTNYSNAQNNIANNNTNYSNTQNNIANNNTNYSNTQNNVANKNNGYTRNSRNKQYINKQKQYQNQQYSNKMQQQYNQIENSQQYNQNNNYNNFDNNGSARSNNIQGQVTKQKNNYYTNNRPVSNEEYLKNSSQKNKVTPNNNLNKKSTNRGVQAPNSAARKQNISANKSNNIARNNSYSKANNVQKKSNSKPKNHNPFYDFDDF